jgi:hypothetical protein
VISIDSCSKTVLSANFFAILNLHHKSNIKPLPVSLHHLHCANMLRLVKPFPRLFLLVGFDSASRPCATRTCIFSLLNFNRTHRPRPLQLRYFSVNYIQRKSTKNHSLGKKSVKVTWSCRLTMQLQVALCSM